jgi:RND family efflux transporter MFP subunit
MAGLAAWGVISRQAELAQAPRFEGPPVTVNTVVAQAGRLTRSRHYLAEAEPVREADVTARFTETVTEVNVDEGDPVAAGDVLVRLDTSEVVARLDGLAADLDQARAQREAEKANRDALGRSADYWSQEVARLHRLKKQDAVSQSDLDEAEDRLNQTRGNLKAKRQQIRALSSRLESLRARREDLRSQRADHALKAPFSGVITASNVDPGDQAGPGKPLVRVSSTERMRLAFGVPEADRPAVETGVNLRFTLAGESHEATIDRIHPALDSARLARAEVDLDSGVTPAPGAEVSVTVALPPLEETVLVPAGALAGGDEQPTIYEVSDGKALARTVTVRGRDGDRVAVSGIEAGASVVTSPYLGWTRLADGMPVTQVQP